VPSPFPGMNPYLEQEAAFHDFHQTFIPIAREFLTAQVSPKGYFVKLDEYVFIHEHAADERRMLGRPDLALGPTAGARTQVTAPGASAAAPAYAFLPSHAIDQEHHSYLTIRDRTGSDVVTVIELLSPSNKNFGGDRNDYLQKRRDFFAAGVHVVEIDLLRGGPRLPLIDVPSCDYLVSISRAEERPRVGLWPIGLRERLPPIPIPLRPRDPDAVLDLQQVLDRAYDGAGYATYIYDGTPQPPLREDDIVWSRQFVPAR